MRVDRSSLFIAPKFEKFYSENPEYKDSNIVAKCMSWNGIMTFNNVKELLPHPTAFIFDSCAGYRSFPYDLDAAGMYHLKARM